MDTENSYSSGEDSTYMYATIGLSVALVVVLLWWWYYSYYSLGVKLWGIFPAASPNSKEVVDAQTAIKNAWDKAKADAKP
jgi:hypothetical protein